MEWRKAKTYILLLLLIINCILFGLIKHNRTDKLSNSRIEGIINILKNFNINVNCELPTSYPPMHKLNTEVYEFDYLKLQNIFFKGKAGVQRTNVGNTIVFTSGEFKLKAKGSRIEFSSDLSLNTKPKKSEFISSIVGDINKQFGNFDLETTADLNDRYVVKFYEKYNNAYVFSNYIYFDIRENEQKIYMNYSRINDTQPKRDRIIASDEAVFALLHELKDSGESINKVCLGYYEAYSTSVDEKFALPCYMIRVDAKEYFVNAYTAEILT